MQVKLIVVNGQARQREMVLDLPAVVGRSRAATLTIGDPLVSRQHCFLEEHGGMVLLRDNGSLNGTILDGQRVQGEAIIRPGAKVTVGPLTFVVIYEPTGEGVQADTGLMPPAAGAAAGAPDFEALMAASDDAEADAEEDAAPDDADLDDAAEGAEASPSAGRATLQWQPPAAAPAAPSFLPPLAAGPGQSPLLPPSAEEPKAVQAEAEPLAPSAKPRADAGKKPSAPDKGKPAAKSKPASAKGAASKPASSKPASKDEPPAADAPAFAWLEGGAGDPADEGSSPPQVEEEDLGEPPDDADDNQLADEEMAEATGEPTPGPTAETPAGPNPTKKTRKKKRSWWPFGKKEKPASTSVADDKPQMASPPDEETDIGTNDDTRQEAATQPPGEEAPAKSPAGAPGAKIDLRPPAHDCEDESSPTEPEGDEENDDDDDDDDSFKQFFKGIG